MGDGAMIDIEAIEVRYRDGQTYVEPSAAYDRWATEMAATVPGLLDALRASAARIPALRDTTDRATFRADAAEAENVRLREAANHIAARLDTFCDWCGGSRLVPVRTEPPFDGTYPDTEPCLDSIHAAADQVRALAEPEAEHYDPKYEVAPTPHPVRCLHHDLAGNPAHVLGCALAELGTERYDPDTTMPCVENGTHSDDLAHQYEYEHHVGRHAPAAERSATDELRGRREIEAWASLPHTLYEGHDCIRCQVSRYLRAVEAREARLREAGRPILNGWRTGRGWMNTDWDAFALVLAGPTEAER